MDPNQCVHCKKSFDSRTALNQHYGKSHREMKFPCNMCGNKFRWPIDVDTHQQEVGRPSLTRHGARGAPDGAAFSAVVVEVVSVSRDVAEGAAASAPSDMLQSNT